MEANGPEAERVRSLRRRARRERERAIWLRDRSLELKARSDGLAEQVAGVLQSRDRPFGEREDAFVVRVGRIPLAVGLVRHELRRWLTRDGVAPEQAAEVALACSEACANAVEHPSDAACHAFEVEARRVEGELELLVRDFGRWDDTPRTAYSRGRGFEIMRRLMDSVEVVDGETGTEIVMRRALARTVT
jgi:anti-sigma regulatory factor (Ser/Thr protein kinase)